MKQQISTSIHKFLLVSLLLSMLAAPQRAKAGLVIKLPSSLGLATNLQGYWTFDGADMYESGTVAADRSGNGNNGAVTGARVGPGKIGQALNFDGIDDLVNAGADFLGTSALSISAWVYRRPIAGQGRIVSNNRTLITTNTLGRMVFKSDGSGAATTANNCAPDNQWTFITVTRDDSGTANWYCNASLSGNANQNSGTPTAGTENVFLGNRGSGAEPWNGFIDEPRVYDRILSIAEIKRLYNMGSGIKTASQTSKITSGLLAYYTFDGADVYENGAVVADKSGNGNNGAVTGARVGPGKIGQALHFDGINDLVNTGSDFIGTSALTISVWVYRENAAGTQRIVGNNRTILSTNTTGRILFISDGSTTISSGNNCADAGKWTHVVVTRTSSGVANFYCSGAQYGTADQASGTPTAGTENVFLGNRGSGPEPWDGPLDEIRIYNRVLSAAEIKELYNQGAGAIAGKTQDTQLTTNLVGYWPFNGPDI